ncbi:CAP domain-containing protein [Paludicola sp. MB14-C6]|uniref:CAP domain-containing protein n=1 Tax=Paludihabitans sp. MB14-C6 TaxID=3070656 RepID=UPI0027DC45C7|nr:CAP domain-containing protein [Paludicola sp. MB14-C6]WMJ23376.1 CAP domain-containing protein [Paludicola sp. MB14-C6]
MKKKYVILMTSVLVFVIMAIVVYTMNFSFLKNTASKNSEKNSTAVETMKDISQQSNENQETSSDITKASSTNENSSSQKVSTSKNNASSQAVEKAATTKPSNTNSTTATRQNTNSISKPAPPPPPKLPITSSDFSQFQTRVLDLVNQERAKAGLNPLTLNAKLSSVATKKSQDMADLNYFDHTSPTYGSPFDMMKQFGVSYQTAGENIAKGQTSPEQVMDGWMNSPGHRANILNASFTQLGVGVVKNANGQLIWTQMFIG